MAITVDCNYPGGNILVRRIEGSTLVVEPDLRDTTEWWFWWNFRVRGAAGQRLRVEFLGVQGAVGPNGPAMSTDGRSWRWAWQADGGGPCPAFNERFFELRVPDGADEIYLAFSFPYQLADLGRFLEAHRDHPDLHVSTLAVTRKGREAPLVTIGDPAAAARNVLFSCRHHACECMGSFVLEGVMDFILSAEGAALRRTTAFTVAPTVDLDGVEDGDQGKCRAPRDHNRDYLDESIYPTVRAVRKIVGRLFGRNLRLYVDFHCPWIRRGQNEATFLVEPPEPYAARVRAFGRVLKEVNDSPVPYTGVHDTAFGTAWNVPTPGGLGSSSYMRACDTGSLLAGFTIETSYSLSEGAVVTPDSARQFGRAVGRAVQRFLDEQA